MPSLEGIQQDNSGSPPKHSLALDGESGLDISLFNLFWPDSFFNQECVRSFQNVCMRGQLLSLLRFFYHFSLKKKKKSVTFCICFLMVKHFKSMFVLYLSLNITLWGWAKQGLSGLKAEETVAQRGSVSCARGLGGTPELRSSDLV